MSKVSTEPCPHVYRAINRITADFARTGIGRTHYHAIDHYKYRSIDDVVSRLAPLLARHRLCVLPRVLKRESHLRQSETGLMASVALLVAFDLVSARDGSCHRVKSWGEALDASDKATAKAMTSAFKYAMLSLFCVPGSTEGGDTGSPKLTKQQPVNEPPQGWDAWAKNIICVIGHCSTAEALDRVRITPGETIKALRREQPKLYMVMGDRFAERLAALKAGAPSATLRPPRGPACIEDDELADARLAATEPDSAGES